MKIWKRLGWYLALRWSTLCYGTFNLGSEEQAHINACYRLFHSTDQPSGAKFPDSQHVPLTVWAQKSFRNHCILILCLLRKPGIPLKLCSIISVCSSNLVFSFPKRKESRDSNHISCYSVLAVILVKFKSFSFRSDRAPPNFSCNCQRTTITKSGFAQTSNSHLRLTQLPTSSFLGLVGTLVNQCASLCLLPACASCCSWMLLALLGALGGARFYYWEEQDLILFKECHIWDMYNLEVSWSSTAMLWCTLKDNKITGVS